MTMEIQNFECFIPTSKGRNAFESESIYKVQPKSSSSLSDSIYSFWLEFIGRGSTNLPKSNKDKESFISWHSHKNLIAVSFNSPDNAIVYIYDANEKQWLNMVLHDEVMSKGIFCLAWFRDLDSLLVGTATGIACWRLYSNRSPKTIHDDKYTTLMQFFEHPQKKAVHCIDVSPTGRLFAAMSNDENKIYIWDATMAICSPIYCLDGIGQSLKWSPSGLHIAITDSSGNFLLLDSYNWKHEPCCRLTPPVASLCWLGGSDCIFFSSLSTHIYTCELQQRTSLATTKANRKTNNSQSSSITVSPVPLVLDTSIFTSMFFLQGDHIGISEITSEEVHGNYAAVSFIECDSNDNIGGSGGQSPLPFVALYLVATKPLLTFTFLRIFQHSSRSRDIFPISFILHSIPLPGPAQPADDDWILVAGDLSHPSSNSSTQSGTGERIYIAITWSNSSISVEAI